MQDDARLRELTFLAELERSPTKLVGPFPVDTPDRRLAHHLLTEGFAVATDESTGPSPFLIKQYLKDARWNAIQRLLLGRQIGLTITHAGAVRRAELEQQLQTGRIKEPMGLIWDGRHFRQDTRIALLDVTSERPLVVRLPPTSFVKHQRIYTRLSTLVRKTANQATAALEHSEGLVALHAAHLAAQVSKRAREHRAQ